MGLAVLLSGCFNNDLAMTLNEKNAQDSFTSGSSPTTTEEDDSSNQESSQANLYISTISVTTSDSSSSFSLFFDNSRSAPVGSKISDFCATQGGNDRSCACEFRWQEINATSGSNVPIPRTVQMPLTTLQSGMVTCGAPSRYSTEINNGTVIGITVVATGSNPTMGQFNVQTKNFTKTGSAQAGSFQDSQGRAFENVLRYTCYDQAKRGLDIVTKKSSPIQHPTVAGDAVELYLGTQFCANSAAGGGGSGTGCDLLPDNDFSAQAHYYNLYIRDSQRGTITGGNQAFTCPRIKESLGNDGTIGTQGKFWPLDQSFALALSASSDFPIGVAARARLSNSTAPDNTNTGCAATQGGGASTGGGSAGGAGDNAILSRCLGFAAKPASDGTCPTLRDSSGRFINTYRLRRLIAIYPPLHDATGRLIATQKTDEILVLDRPVSSTTADPSKPFTMRGPKPCPFAYFDHRGVTSSSTPDPDYAPSFERPGGKPGYVATGHSLWNGTNVDGTQFPNQDIAGLSCSATFPVLNASGDTFGMATIHPNNPALPRKYVRPIQAWFPHYEEDISFQACAPQAQPVIDPPLHFAKDTSTGNVGWCAEVYPTQNPYVSKLDSRRSDGTYVGRVKNFTSHAVKNSNSPSCTATQLDVATSVATQDPYELPPSSLYALPTGSIRVSGASQCNSATASTIIDTGVAYHPNNLIIDSTPLSTPLGASATCRNNGLQTGGAGAFSCNYCAHQTCDRTVVSPGLAWEKFPLLASANQVEAAIAGDTTYGCMITYDNNSGKTGRKTPTGGCCGDAVKMKTGQTTITSADYMNAHLEPGTASTPCMIPNY
jgi:hypothetical protein